MRIVSALALSLGLSSVALASAPVTPVTQHIIGSVKTLDAQKHILVVTGADGKDHSFGDANAVLAPSVKVGVKVDVAYSGALATAVNPVK